jgi:hypothetical protein
VLAAKRFLDDQDMVLLHLPPSFQAWDETDLHLFQNCRNQAILYRLVPSLIGLPTTQPGAQGAISGAAGTEIELQYAGDGRFRITRARGRVEVDGTVISEILPRRP